MIRIALLGGFTVTVDGEPLALDGWAGRRPAELVQLLALADGRRLAREVVVDRLWPDLPLDAGVANLHKAAHHARRALGVPDAVVLRAGVVALLPDTDVDIDTVAFEAAARRALASGDPASCGAAADLCGGDLLPEAPYATWTQAPRRHLQQLQRRLLREAERWQSLLEVDPTDEQAHRGLMRQLADAGRPHAAVRQYRQLTVALAATLGAARPGAATRALYEELVGSVARAGRQSFVGRESELVRLSAAVRDGGDGPVRVILIRGDAGMGKTALCRRLIGEHLDRDRTVIAVDAELADGVAYGVLREIAAAAAARLDAAQLSPPVATTLDRLASADPDDPPLARQQVLGAVAAVLQAVTETGPTLLVVDDAHRADRGSLDLLAALTGGAVPGPLTTVFVHRPEHAGFDAVRAGLRLRGATEIALGPLSVAESEQLARQVAGPQLADEVVARIRRLAGGHPFYTRELATSLADNPSGPLPASLTSVVLAGLDTMSPPTVALLEDLAVTSTASDLDTVLAVSARDEAAIVECLDEALEHKALHLSDGRYVFRHQLLRHALLERLTPHRRAQVHRRIADGLAGLGAPAAVVAGHWLDGGRPDEALPWLLRAAGDAARAGAPRDALRLLDRAADLAPADPDVLASRADLLLSVGDPSAPAVYARAAAVAVADPPVAVHLRAQQAWALMAFGEVRAAHAVLGELPDPPGHDDVRLDLARGYLQWLVGETDRAGATLARVKDAALRRGSPIDVMDALMLEGLVAHASADWPRLMRSEVLRLSDLAALAGMVYDVHLCVAETWLYGATPYDEVIAFAGDLEQVARDAGRRRGIAFAITLRGEAELLTGDLTAAVDHLRDGADHHRRVGATGGEALALQRLAEAAVLGGHPEEAVEPLAQGFAHARTSPMAQQHLLSRLHGTAIRAATSADEAHARLLEAEATLLGPAEMCTSCLLPLAVPAAVAAATVGDLERADTHAEIARRSARMVRRPAWDAALVEVDAHRAQARGETTAAAELFRRAAEAFARTGQPLDEARCQQLA